MVSGERPVFGALVFLSPSPLNWVVLFHRQAFLDDYCATAAESLLKHVLLRAKGRVALRRLGSSAASPHNNRDHHDHLGDETTSMSSSISCESKGGDEQKEEDTEAIGPKSPAGSPLASKDMSGDNSYAHQDDAFDDSDIDDDGAARACSTDTTTPGTAPTILPTVESSTAPAVPPRKADASTVFTTTLPGSSLSGDVPNVGPRQQNEQQQQQELQQDATVEPATPSTPRTPPLSSVAMAMTSDKGESKRNGDVPSDEDEVAHQTGGCDKSGRSDEIGKLRKQTVPVSARR